MIQPGRFDMTGAVAALVLAGCIATPVAVDQGPAPPPLGPILVIDIVNNVDREITVSYDFEAGNTSGGGEGTLPGCEHTSLTFGELAGDYRVRIDGATVVEAAVPVGLRDRGWMVIRAIVGPDGTVELGAVRWSVVEPPFVSRPIGGCG